GVEIDADLTNERRGMKIQVHLSSSQRRKFCGHEANLSEASPSCYNVVMTVQLNLPEELEQRLLAEVKIGRHATLEEAILEKLSRAEEPDLLALMRAEAEDFRRHLDDAWNDRRGAVDGESVFARIAEKSAVLKAQGK